MDILGCTGTVSQRAAVLHKIILLAQALKEHAHNLYSFSAVMKALEMHQVSKIKKLWLKTRLSKKLGFSLAVFMFVDVDCTAGDDMACIKAEPHRDGGLIREDTQTLHEPAE